MIIDREGNICQKGIFETGIWQRATIEMEIWETVRSHEKDLERIVVYLCNEESYNSRFSEYDGEKEEEDTLIRSLSLCNKKDIKYIGF